MAKIDVMTFDGEKKTCLNLDHAVGIASSRNDPDDVMLIQAMLQFIKIYNRSAPFSRAIQDQDVPGVSGILDLKTMKAIWSYQRADANILLRVDGIIEPAKYQNINIVLKNYRVMTIMALDIDCQNAFVNYGSGYIKAIINKFPRLSFLNNRQQQTIP